MNEVVEQVTGEASTDIRTVSVQTNALILDQGSMDSMLRVADMMASSKVTIPSHLRNSPGDCMAVVMQAMQWNMNPFAVAQKTHLSQSGALGYEAQLINAAVVSCGALKGQPDYKFLGDWDRILGKVEERRSDKGGKYYVATYTKDDEEGLGVICYATLRGESNPREVKIMMSQCYPRFSTQWATDPKQQICYVAVRKFSRLHVPGAILGVHTPDELDETVPPREVDITPPPAVEQRQQLPVCTDEAFKENSFKWKKNVEEGKKTPDALLAMLSTRAVFTEQQRAEIMSWKTRAEQAATTGNDDFNKALDESGEYTPE